MISFFILRLTFFIFHCIYHFSWEMGDGKWELRTANCRLRTIFFRCGSATGKLPRPPVVGRGPLPEVATPQLVFFFGICDMGNITP